jgi:hypothetical protein
MERDSPEIVRDLPHREMVECVDFMKLLGTDSPWSCSLVKSAFEAFHQFLTRARRRATAAEIGWPVFAS